MSLPLGQQDMAVLHAEMLKILLEFDRICKTHQIPYQLAAGTLLGAVRHQGFIPWDDDADVCMLREDYERFLKVAATEIGPDFFLHNNRTDAGVPYHFTKLRLISSKFQMEGCRDLNTPCGAFIDIFPFDYVDTRSIFGMMRFELFNILDLLQISPFIVNNTQAGRKRAAYKKILLSIAVLAHKMVGVQRLKLWTNLILDNCRLLKTDQVTCVVSSLWRRKARYARIRSYEQFTTLTSLRFSGYEFPVPANYHQVLTNLYGDYMKLPPPHQQVASHGAQLLQNKSHQKS
ncbi:MAG: LicD family protein [Pararheinheimera sp.]|nr:LicD family protein [Rheinheimera sp.]